MSRILAAVCSALRGVLTDCRGGLSAPFAILLVPAVGMVGGAVDYGYYYSARTKMAVAADAAVLAAVGKVASGGDTTSAKASGLSVFSAQSDDVKNATVAGADLQVVDQGLTRTATLTYSGSVKTSFMQVLGFSSIGFTGSSVASSAKLPYIDFYMLLDNTPSMGVGATTADINKMVANTPDQCAFACHDTSNANNYYNKAKTLGVTMRIDVVRTATQALIDNANATATAGQYRVGVYSFGATAPAAKLTKVQPLTSNLPNAKTNAGTVDLMTVPNNNYNNDMDTPMNDVLASINSEIAAPGDGSTAANPQKILFFVSDGVADQNLTTAAGCSQPVSGANRCQMPINPAQCTTIKNRGIKIAVLYTTYLPLPTNAWYNTWIKPFQATISANMQACASPGLFFEVSPSQGITEAMLALFDKATAMAHLTN
ncbi:TadE/TadG family type IV pilus assembly protein [uncultured Alsobacter sp.]|uniref:TadE/TadG family type IV pilus assembly protein n=1 Tax=uncultured Alsobacter sp. TaxID=1748258 RepID=UPI0025D7EC30|nr:pilus assembly protein TadG-related protein [uncultured Alsobacter sp.]